MKYNIDRFVQMHKMYYPDALKEIKNGYKMTHWMWYIFPQLKGLGHSYKAEYYGLDGVEEAIEYMKNEYLKNNMLEICSELIKVDDDVKYIFGYPIIYFTLLKVWFTFPFNLVFGPKNSTFFIFKHLLK